MTTKKDMTVRIVGLALFAGLLAGITGAVGATVVMAEDPAKITDGADGVPCHSQHGPEPTAEDRAKIDELHQEIDGIMLEYGFVYEEPESLTSAQEDKLNERITEIYTSYEKSFAAMDDRFNPLTGFEPTEEQIQEMDRLFEKMDGEANAVMREYGFVIENPVLSEQKEQEMSKRLEVVYVQLDELYGTYYPYDDMYIFEDSAVQSGSGQGGSAADDVAVQNDGKEAAGTAHASATPRP